MPKPLTSFIQSPATAVLTSAYGDCLENMPLDKKLMAIRSISAALLDNFSYSDVDLDIADQSVCLMERGYKVGTLLYEALAALDGFDEQQALALLGALTEYAKEDFQQLGC